MSWIKKDVSIVKHVIGRLLLQPASVPPFLQYFLTLFQFLTFTIFISSKSLVDQSLIFADVIQRNMVIFLSLLLVLRFLTRLSVIKSIYVMLLIWNVQCSFTIMSIVVYLLLGLNVIIDVISKVQFSFETKNIHSSTYPWIIFIHYLVFAALTILRFIDLPQAYIFPLCQIGGVIFMLILQERSFNKYEDFKNIHLRFYFLTAFYALAQIYEIFLSPQPLWKSVFAIITSQLLYHLIQWKFQTQFTLEQYLSKKLEVEAGFFIFSYLYSKKQINKTIIKALKTLANQDTNCLMQDKNFKQGLMSETKRLMNKQFSNFQSTTSFQTKQATLRLIAIINGDSSIYAQLLIAQLALFQLDQHVKCRQILNKLLQKTRWYNLLSHILINKIQKKLMAHLKIEHDKRVSSMFYEFIQNNQFRNLLLRSAVNFIQLWEYTKVRQGIYKRINYLAEKVINGQQKITKFYDKMKTKCIKINLLYGSYLFLVERDTKKANQIMERLYFNQQKEQNLQCDSKVYLKIAIQLNEPLRIEAVGSNVNKHLGYQKRMMVGMNINNLLPEFYKDFHDKIVVDALENQTPRFFLFTRNTIVKHAKGNYVIVLLCLRIAYQIDGQLYLQGFIKVDTDERHNWHNYLFVKNATKQIVQCSMLVNDKISSIKGKRFSADQFFDNISQGQYWKKVQKFSSELNKYYYQPVLSLNRGQQRVTMFVELDPYGQNISLNKSAQNQKQQNSKRKILIPQMIVYPKYRVFENIKHYLRLKISTQQILRSLKYKIIIFIFIMALMLIGVYVLQGVNVVNVNNEYTTKLESMKLTQNILRHYMGLSKIAVDLSYHVVNEVYGYQFPSFNISLRESIMTVQQTNQFFKPYSISQWQYESLSPVQQYRTCYEFVSEVLAAATFVDQAPNDPLIRANMIHSYNKLFTQTFLWSYPQYTTRIQQQLGQNTQNRDIYHIIKIIVLSALSIILYVFIIKLQKSIRQTEHQTLKFISSLTFQGQIIDKTKEFIYLITQEKIENLTTTTKGVLSTFNTKDFNHQATKLSEISARQSTGRDLMGNISGRDTLRTAQNPQQQSNQQFLAQNSPIKLKPANKIFIILPLILLLVVIALQVFNYVINVKLKQIDEAQSSKNIVEWMNKPLYFTRLLNAFLTEDRGPQFTDHDGTFYKTYKAFEESYNTVASFDEVNYEQFSDFEEKLRKIRFQYLCTYASCPDFDKDYVNILYTTTMQKLAQYMLANQYFMNDPNNKMNTILMSQQLFRDIMTDLIETYIKGYKQYANNYKGNQMLFITIIFAALSILLLILGLQTYFNIYKGLSKHFRICDIIKESSYLIKKDDLISFQQEELQRQKTQKKNQKSKKKNKLKQKQDEIEQKSQLQSDKSKVIEDKSSPKGKKQVEMSRFNKDRVKDKQEIRTSKFKDNQKFKKKK